MPWTIAVSGPESTRAQAEVALEDARIPVYPDGHHATSIAHVIRGEEPEGTWLVVEHADVDAVVHACAPAGWALRAHYETPEAPPPSEADKLMATIGDMQSEIAALRARVGA